MTAHPVQNILEKMLLLYYYLPFMGIELPDVPSFNTHAAITYPDTVQVQRPDVVLRVITRAHNFPVSYSYYHHLYVVQQE